MESGQVIRVREVMRDSYVMVDGLSTVQEGIDAMRKHDADSLIICKRHPDDEYGLVLLVDIAKEILAKDRSPSRINLYEIMSKPVLSVSPNMDVRYCARMFERFGINQAPVISNGEVMGMISYKDIVLKSMVE